MHVVVGDINMAGKYVEITKEAQKLARAFLPGPLTLILNDKSRVSGRVVGERKTLGIRIPENDFARELVVCLQTPITATSANKSGDLAPYSIEEVHKSFGSSFGKISLVVDAGELPKVAPSTLVDLTGREPKIVRNGPISREAIFAVLG